MPPRRTPLMEISENDAPSSTNAPTNRRQSGRAVRAPQKFVPDASSSQTGSASGKRKRGGKDTTEDAENDVSEDDIESDEEDESVDEEETKQSKKRAKNTKKPVAKKPKVNGTALQPSAPAVKLPNRAKKPRKVVIADESAEGLYAEIFTSGESSDAIAAAWLRRYEEDNTASMTDFVNCVLKSTGCDMKVTEDDINDPDNAANRINDLQEEYKGHNIVDYPLISKVKTSHVFKVSLTDFFKSLVATMHASSVLYDDIALIENIHLWVTTMSSSVLRPFRHTATVVALATATGLCEVVRQQAKKNADSLRQLESERKRKGANKERVAKIQKMVKEGNTQQEICENTIRDFFDTVFVHRYRDIDPKIRTDCVEALGQWINILPNIFLEGTFLRYLGWMLSDISAPTRHEVIKQLEKIMKMDNIGGVRDFIERFRPRIVEMAARDSEVSVRTSAIDLLDMIRKAGMLEPDDIDIIGKLIFDAEVRVRNAVVPFFAENINDLYEGRIDELGGEETLEEVFTVDVDDHESPRPGWIKLKCLVEVLLSYDSDDREESPSQIDSDNDPLLASHLESRFSLAAKALYDRIPEMRDWESLAGYLLFDHSNKVNPKSKTADIEIGLRRSFKLDEEEEVALLEMLDAVVKLSLDQLDEHDKPKERGKKKKPARLDSVELQESIARRLALLIPRLLSKFGAKPKTAAAVLRLEQLLNLDVFQALRLGESTYTKLLHEIGVQFKGHADHRVLSEASAALLHARSYEELEDITEENMQSLWDDTVEDMRTRFLSSTKARFTSRGDLSVELLTELAHTVARVSKLASIMDPVHRLENNRVVADASAGDRASMVPIDIIFELVGRGILVEADEVVDDIEDQLAISACQSTLFYFMWKVRSLQQRIANSESIPDSDVDKINDRLNSFSSTLYKVFSSRAGLDDLRLAATGTLLDVHVLFSTLLPAKKVNQQEKWATQYAHLYSLTINIEPEVQEEITSIFAAAEKQYAKKARKVLEAPADDEEPEDIDSEPEDEEDEEDEAERRNDALKAEQKLCELTGKIALAILAEAIDASGSMKGKLRNRVQRNRNKLGANFKEILAYLDPKSKGVKKSHKGKAQAATTSRKDMKSTEVVDDDEDQDEDPFADVEPEEGTIEDLRRRELLDEDPPESIDEENENGEAQGVNADDDAIGD